MAALSEYPIQSALVRGDPIEIPVNITVAGSPIDVSGFTWRAQIRTGFDGQLVTAFTTTVQIPSGGTLPSQVLLTLDDVESRKLENGYVFDLEQLDGAGETIRTWWICTRLNIQRDVSYDETLRLAKARQPSVEHLR
jgi:hypothetical protein